MGKVVPYGVYDIGANLGYVGLEIDHDTGEFAVNAVRCWLDQMGWKLYPGMRRLMITADGGGSNGSRLRLWKLALQQLADETGLIIQVCHYPPGTSKWNKIEHRMFCHITQNWRATPLLDLLIVIELIANTTTKTGLKIRCELDSNTYPTGIKVSDAEMATLNMTRSFISSRMELQHLAEVSRNEAIVFGHRRSRCARGERYPRARRTPPRSWGWSNPPASAARRAPGPPRPDHVNRQDPKERRVAHRSP